MFTKKSVNIILTCIYFSRKMQVRGNTVSVSHSISILLLLLYYYYIRRFAGSFFTEGFSFFHF
jgi:hypothetical protein